MAAARSLWRFGCPHGSRAVIVALRLPTWQPRCSRSRGKGQASERTGGTTRDRAMRRLDKTRRSTLETLAVPWTDASPPEFLDRAGRGRSTAPCPPHTSRTTQPTPRTSPDATAGRYANDATSRPGGHPSLPGHAAEDRLQCLAEGTPFDRALGIGRTRDGGDPRAHGLCSSIATGRKTLPQRYATIFTRPTRRHYSTGARCGYSEPGRQGTRPQSAHALLQVPRGGCRRLRCRPCHATGPQRART